MIHFLLTPDKSASLALKRLVAQQSARMDVVVGTWPELLMLVKNSHVIPIDASDWKAQLTIAMREQTGAFWSESLKNVPAEEEAIVDIIDRNLTMLLESVGTDKKLETLLQSGLAERLGKRLNDFAKLHAALDYQLPPDLKAIRNILNITPDRILRNIRVYNRDSWPRLNPWQQALITALNSRADGAADSSLAALLNDVVTTPSASADSTLHHLQVNLFSTAALKKPLDGNLQWLGCRDYLQEAEITAGMIQKAKADDSSLIFSDFALLLPSDDRYRQAVTDAFSLAGIPLAGLRQEITGSDLGREVIYYFLLCKKELAPAMALTTLLTSPLMPWTLEDGHRMAQKVIKGDFNLEALKDADVGSKVMLALIRKSISTVTELGETLEKFLNQLRSFSKPEELLYASRKRADETVKALKEKMTGSSSMHSEAFWNELLRTCKPQPDKLNVKTETDLTREGAAVFHEGEEPWRRVRHLFVLGCSEGHYPSETVRSSVFFDADLKELNSECGLNLETSEERGKRIREVFRQQLCASSGSVVFTVPRRDGMGKSLAPSPALAFMASLIDGLKDDEQLIIDLDSETGRGKVSGLAIADEQCATPPWKPVPADLELGADLVALKEGAESPSRLEKLMVSPLAWLFERMKIEAQEWVPEQLDVMMKGTLAHKVFEKFFDHNIPLPTAEEIDSKTTTLLNEAIKEKCPFLSRDEWKVERDHLVQDIIKAAQRWSEILKDLGATVVATEVRLKGTLNLATHGDLPVHGDADLLLELPGNRLFVVDYKKSASKDRRLRMQAGYDHQATLYRVMIETGGLEYQENARPALLEDLGRFRDSYEICALYYLMNDQQVLTDSSGWLGNSFPGRPEMGSGISREALPLIEKRIGQVRRGKVELNSSVDEAEYEKNRGIKAKYSLDSSPVVRMFVKGPNSASANQESQTI